MLKKHNNPGRLKFFALLHFILTAKFDKQMSSQNICKLIKI